jgi:hypothetical protein
MASAYVFAEVIPDQDYVIMREVLIEDTAIALYDFLYFTKSEKPLNGVGILRTLEQFENNHLIIKIAFSYFCKYTRYSLIMIQ